MIDPGHLGADCPPRVLLVSANFRPSVGGVERFVETLAERLAAASWQVTVLCCQHGRAPLTEQRGGVRIVRLPSNHLLERRWRVPYPLPSPIALFSQLRRLVRWSDVVHVQDAMYATSVAALASARARGVPSLLTQHVGLVPQSSRVLDAIESVAISTLGRSSRLATHVVAYNADVAAWAERKWHLPCVQVVPIGIADPRCGSHSDRHSIRRALDLPEDRFIALFVGRDVPKKRLDVVLAARDDSYEIVALTDRPRGHRIEGVHILPFLPPDRYRDLLLSVDSFVLPSEAEGIPLALQEALLAGLPCVVTRVPGYERYLGEEDVLWVDPGPGSIRDALTNLVCDDALRRRLTQRARAAGEREFDLDRCVDAYQQLYRELVDATPSSRRGPTR